MSITHNRVRVGLWIHRVFKGYARTKIKIKIRSFKLIDLQYTGSPKFKILEQSLNYFLDIFKNYFSIFITVNELNSKNSQSSKSVINFQGTVIIFKEFQVPFKDISNSSTFKEFKDLPEPRNKASDAT